VIDFINSKAEYAAVFGSSGVSASCYGRPEDIGIQPVVVLELRFSDVERQVLRANPMMRADDGPLNETPETLNRIRVNSTDNVLAGAVIDHLMVGELAADIAVSLPRIGAKQAHLVGNALAQKAVDRRAVQTLHNARHDIALTLHGTDDGDLAGRTSARPAAGAIAITALVFVPVLGLTTDKGLIHFHNAHQFLKLAVHEGRANLVADTPSSAIRTKAHHAMNLQGANAFLAGQHQMDDAEPFAEALVGVLKNGVDQHAKAVTGAGGAVVALPVKGLGLEFSNSGIAAARAAHTIGPAGLNQISLARFIVGEHRLKLADGHLLNLDSVSHSDALFPTVRTS